MCLFWNNVSIIPFYKVKAPFFYWLSPSFPTQAPFQSQPLADRGLLTALPTSMLKPPSERGSFDAMVTGKQRAAGGIPPVMFVGL
jgi:hypothetical protein